MAWLLEWLAAATLLAGASVVAAAALGVARFPDPFTRMHAATKAGVVGSGLILLGAGLALGTATSIATALLAVAFLLATTPIAAHLLGRAAYVAGTPIAPATVGNALEGVLDRKLFDIDPARRVRTTRRPPPASEEAAMTAVPIRDPSIRNRAQGHVPLRRLVCWLAGAGAQKEASAAAIELARQSGARLTALSMLDPAVGEPSGAVPIGGSYWAKWLATSRRTRMRQASAHAFAEFQELAREAGIEAEARHEEGGLASLPARVAAADLVIVPAGIDGAGDPVPPADELAALIARARLVPVLRVNRRPGAVRRVALLVGTSPDCSRLAQGLTHGGLWPEAEVTVIPVGEETAAADTFAQSQIELLLAHGRRAVAGAAITGSHSTEEVATALRRYDAIVMATLSTRSGWFGAVRTDIHEVAAETCATILLP